MSTPSRPTLKDVARAAGVSPGVASTVLRGNANAGIRVSPPTCERVRQAAQQLDYRPNALARSLQSRSTRTILLAVYFIESLTRVPFLAQVLDGALNQAAARGFDLTIHVVRKEDGEKPAVLGDGRADGCLWVAPWLDDAAISSVAAAGSPLVVLYARVPGGPRCVVADNRRGIELAVEHLVELGHRRLVYGCDPENMTTHDCRERAAAFVEACAARSLTAWIAPVADLPALMARGPARRPTGVVGWNDDHAIRVLDVMRELGLGVPGDVSITGFDSTRECAELRPSLTSVYQPIREIAGLGVNMLVDMIEGAAPPRPLDGSGNIHLIPCRLDVRDSTGPAP